ncbi:adhesin-like protein [Methanobrevibacter ruminantium M1]|uniref:Adhesin-like protein n=1 Tax=Methanobrevibacter ruminantium (strain ATCC 35063 / DSM 1093 / JCM 13430 / OCM 146 / M1) TaxID=634498 RepID=D3DYK4_METRM|nr:Ig-like domain repeat protein [Methanobrevibacter ruminantium]ADC45924.1 adhesin-like protein [Methanobrevibacter ruminantium M1]
MDKKIFIVSFILLAIFTIGAVGASDVSELTANDLDDNALSLNDGEDLLAGDESGESGKESYFNNDNNYNDENRVNANNLDYGAGDNDASKDKVLSDNVSDYIYATTLSVSVDDTPQSQYPTATVSLNDLSGNPVAEASVSVSVDGDDYMTVITTTDGTCPLSLDNYLSVGSHKVGAEYSGDGTYGPSSASTTFNVLEEYSSYLNTDLFIYTGTGREGGYTSVTGKLTHINQPISNATISLYVDDDFYSNLTTDKQGEIEGMLFNISVGRHELRGEYVGDRGFEPSNATKYFNVLPKDSVSSNIQMTLNASDAQVGTQANAYVLLERQYGGPMEDATISISVDDVFYMNVTTNALGYAFFDLSDDLSVGSHKLSGEYPGNEYTGSSSASITFNILPVDDSSYNFTVTEYANYLDTNTTVLDISSKYYVNGSFNVSVVSPNGTLSTFTQDCSPDGHNNWSMADFGIDGIGSYIISGSLIFKNETLTHFDNQTFHAICIRPIYMESTEANNPLDILVVYNSSDATKVSVNGSGLFEGRKITDGPIVWNLTDLNITELGDYNISVMSYDSKGNLIDRFDYNLTIGPNGDDYKLYAKIDPNSYSTDDVAVALYCPNASWGNDIEVHIYMGNPLEVLTFFPDSVSPTEAASFKKYTLADLRIENSNDYRVEIKDFALNQFPGISFNIKVCYSNMILVSGNGSFEIDFDGASVNATLTDSNGNPISNASVSALVNGVESNCTTDDNGNLIIPFEGNTTVKLTYIDNNGVEIKGTGKYVKESVIKNRTETKIIYQNMTTTTVNSNVDGRIGKYFEVSLQDADGNPIANKTVFIGFNGKVYNRTTNSTGGVSLQINLGYAGKYTFAIAFLGDDDYMGSFEVALITVNKQTPKITASSKAYRPNSKAKSLVATLKSAKGNAISGKKISFTINGKTYSTTTNAKGLATLNVSLSKKGTYSCTAKYAGDGMYKATSTKFSVKIA